jgi:hypothetical protein
VTLQQSCDHHGNFPAARGPGPLAVAGRLSPHKASRQLCFEASPICLEKLQAEAQDTETFAEQVLHAAAIVDQVDHAAITDGSSGEATPGRISWTGILVWPFFGGRQYEETATELRLAIATLRC